MSSPRALPGQGDEVRTPRRRSILGAGTFIVPAMLQKLIPFVALPLLARQLSLSDFGSASVLTTLFLLGSAVLVAGQDTVIFHRSRGMSVTAEQQGIAEPIGVVYAVNSLALLVLGLGVAVACVANLGEWYFAVLVELVSACVYSIGYAVNVTIYRINTDVRRFFVAAIGFTALQFSLKIGLTVHATLPLIMWAFSDLVASIAVWLFGWFHHSTRPKFRILDRLQTRSSSRMGLPLVPSKLFQWLQTSSDRPIMARLVGSVDVGRYAVASQFNNAALAITVELCRYFAPQMADFLPRGERAHSGNRATGFRMAVHWQVCGISIIAIALSCLGPLMVSFLYPADFSSARPSVAVLGLSLWLAGIGYVLINFATISRGVTGRIWIYTALGAGVTIVANFFLISWIGILGAAVSSVLGYACTAIVLVWADWEQLRESGVLSAPSIACFGVCFGGVASGIVVSDSSSTLLFLTFLVWASILMFCGKYFANKIRSGVW